MNIELRENVGQLTPGQQLRVKEAEEKGNAVSC